MQYNVWGKFFMQQNQDLIVFLVIAWSAVLLALGIFFIVFFKRYNKNLKQKQKEAISNLYKGQQNERGRIARDLHDGLGIELTSIINVVDEIEVDNMATGEKLETVKSKIATAMKTIRQISHDLMPQSLNKYGLVYTIEKLVEDNWAGKIPFYFNHNGENIPISNETAFHLYKITQELLQNSIKHSEATETMLDLYYFNEKKRLEYTYTDNGKGIKDGIQTDGIGFKNIYTRAAIINGHLSVDGDYGFRLVLIINIEG